jgi:hypothetical protein
MITHGSAEDSSESFRITIKPYIAGGFILYIKFSGSDRHGETGAGIWPTVEKAKEIAQHTASSLLRGAVISWDD